MVVNQLNVIIILKFEITRSLYNTSALSVSQHKKILFVMTTLNRSQRYIIEKYLTLGEKNSFLKYYPFMVNIKNIDQNYGKSTTESIFLKIGYKILFSNIDQQKNKNIPAKKVQLLRSVI